MENSAQKRSLINLKERAENLWNSLKASQDPAQKDKLRKEYETAFREYKRQLKTVQDSENLTSISQSDNRPDIFQYRDYRIFVRDLLAFYQSEPNQEELTAKKVSQRMDREPQYLDAVLSGNSTLNPNEVDKLQALLGLKKKEIQFFKALVVLVDGPQPRYSHKGHEIPSGTS